MKPTDPKPEHECGKARLLPHFGGVAGAVGRGVLLLLLIGVQGAVVEADPSGASQANSAVFSCILDAVTDGRDAAAVSEPLAAAWTPVRRQMQSLGFELGVIEETPGPDAKTRYSCQIILLDASAYALGIAEVDKHLRVTSIFPISSELVARSGLSYYGAGEAATGVRGPESSVLGMLRDLKGPNPPSLQEAIQRWFDPAVEWDPILSLAKEVLLSLQKSKSLPQLVKTRKGQAEEWKLTVDEISVTIKFGRTNGRITALSSVEQSSIACTTDRELVRDAAILLLSSSPGDLRQVLERRGIDPFGDGKRAWSAGAVAQAVRVLSSEDLKWSEEEDVDPEVVRRELPTQVFGRLGALVSTQRTGRGASVILVFKCIGGAWRLLAASLVPKAEFETVDIGSVPRK